MTSRYSEDDWVPISSLQHYAYCPRQCSLIHVSQIFDENLYTLRGRTVHERVHDEGGEVRRGLRVERALPIWSVEHGLTGKADIVEFHGELIRPVEYKAGRLRNRRGREADRIQLCAQTLCLEEMFAADISEGELFYAGSQRRTTVHIDDCLRQNTLEVVQKVKQQVDAAELPVPVNDARCRDCSLREGCVPATAELSSERLTNYHRSLSRSAAPS